MVGEKLQYVGIEFRTQRLSWNGTGEARVWQSLTGVVNPQSPYAWCRSKFSF